MIAQTHMISRTYCYWDPHLLYTLPHVAGVNESPPVIPTDPYNANIAENAAIDDSVQTVTATDADSGIDGKLLMTQYRLLRLLMRTVT